MDRENQVGFRFLLRKWYLKTTRGFDFYKEIGIRKPDWVSIFAKKMESENQTEFRFLLQIMESENQTGVRFLLKNGI